MWEPNVGPRPTREPVPEDGNRRQGGRTGAPPAEPGDAEGCERCAPAPPRTRAPRPRSPRAFRSALSVFSAWGRGSPALPMTHTAEPGGRKRRLPPRTGGESAPHPRTPPGSAAAAGAAPACRGTAQLWTMRTAIPATERASLGDFCGSRASPVRQNRSGPGLAAERGAPGRSKRPARQPSPPPALPLAAGTAAAGASSAFLLPQHWGLAALKENPLLTTCQCYIPPQSNFY